MNFGGMPAAFPFECESAILVPIQQFEKGVGMSFRLRQGHRDPETHMNRSGAAAPFRAGGARGLAWFVSITAALGLLTGCPGREDESTRLRRAFEKLEKRITPARVPGFDSRPLHGVTRGNDTSETEMEAKAAAYEVLRSPKGRAPRLLAVANLVVGRPGDAVALIERELSNGKASADDWASLAAARHENGVVTNDPLELFRAIGAADRAIELDSRSAEALYNRMLVLERVGLGFAQREAAAHYLAIDATSHWATDVRRRTNGAIQTREETWKKVQPHLEHSGKLGDLAAVQNMVAEFPQEARTWAETEYLFRWAEAFEAGRDKDATEWLNVARTIGSALRRKSGEGLLSAAVTSIDEAPQDRTTLRRLARAHRTYRAARLLNHRRNPTEALPMFREAELLFRGAGNTAFGDLAAYFAANALYDLNRHAEVAATLDRVLSSNLSDRHALRAQALWLRSTLLALDGRLWDALADARESAEGFERLGEPDFVVRMRSACAAYLIALGQTGEGWRMHATALAGAGASGNGWLVETVMNAAVRTAISEREWLAARALVTIAGESTSISPPLRADALLWREFLDARVRSSSEAPPSFVEARAAALSMKDGTLRSRALEEITFATAVVRKDTEPNEAIAALSRVIDDRVNTGREAFIVRPLVERARAFRGLRRDNEAVEDLRRAVEIVEHQHAPIEEDLVRDTFFGRADDAYEELATILAEREAWDETFRVLEQSRARLLAEREVRRGKRLEPISLASFSHALPVKDVVVHFTAFENRLLILTIERGRSDARTVAVARSHLSASRDALTEAIVRGDEAGARNAGRNLYDLLLSPLEKRLGPDRTLVIVPDETLAPIPFAALVDRSGRYLVETVPVVVAPSARTYAAVSGKLEVIATGAAVAVIADPAFDPAMTPALTRLPGAADEARRLKRLVPNTKILLGADATRSAFLAAARDTNILHIAAHAITNDRDASLTVIPLAPGHGDRGLLYLRDIVSLDLSNTPLVILAGCKTASSSAGHGSIRSLAAAFLAGGAQSVLASLWDVADDATGQLSLGFYRFLLDGHEPAQALRFAQIEMIRSADPSIRGIRAWGALQVYGRGSVGYGNRIQTGSKASLSRGDKGAER